MDNIKEDYKSIIPLIVCKSGHSFQQMSTGVLFPSNGMYEYVIFMNFYFFVAIL